MERIHSFDTMKVFAMLAIICIHTSPFLHGIITGNTELPYLELIGLVINKGARFAVPLFFMISGYLLAIKVSKGKSHTELIKISIKRLGFLFIAWSVFYVVVIQIVSPDQLTNRFNDNSVQLFLEGGIGALWFLLSLLIAHIIVLLLDLLTNKYIPLILGLILLFIGVYGGLYDVFDLGISPRLGPFLSVFCTGFGYYTFYLDRPISLIASLSYLLLGISCHTIESVIVYIHHLNTFWCSYGLGTILYSIGVFYVCISIPSLGKNTILPKLGGLTLGVYVTHQFIKNIIIYPIQMFISNDIIQDIVFPFAIYVVSLGVVWLMMKNKTTKILIS